MHKHLINFAGVFGLMLLSLMGISAAAQDYPSPATRIPYVALGSPPTFTRADTARAIRRLFKSRRGGGTGWLAVGTASQLASILPAQQSTSAGVWTPGVVAGSAFMLIGLNKRIQFRPERERQILRELAATGRLAPSVARRLRGNAKVVKGAASDYNPLLAEGIAPAIAPVATSSLSVQDTPGNPAPLPDTAQAAATSTPPLYASSLVEQKRTMAYSDTLRAISRLFERRRRGGFAWQMVGLGGALSLARGLASPDAGSNSVSAGGVVAIVGICVAAPVAVGSVNRAAYKKERQDEIEQAYRARRSLPANIRQRLKKKDLQPYD